MLAIVLVFLQGTVARIHECASRGPSIAQLFTYEDMGSYKRVNSTQCGQTSYILYPKDQAKPNLGSAPGVAYFGVPLAKVAVTQTPPNTFLEMLGVRDKIAVASGYTTSVCIAKKIADGDALTFISHAQDSAAHAQQMNDHEVDAIFADPWSTSAWQHAPSASKVICAAPTYERSPLASAEWIKFFGYFFGKEPEANTAYCGTHSRYACNSLVANHMTTNLAHTPRVLFASRSWNGNLSLQMAPYKTVFARDAGGVYPNLAAYERFKQMHWTGTQVAGFTFGGADIDEFHSALRLADVLIDESYPHGQTLKMIGQEYQLPSLIIGQTFLMAVDDPAQGNAGWALVSHGVGETLFTVDEAGDVVPSLARSVVRNGDTWVMTLQTGRRFSDGTLVTAADVKASLERTNALNDAARSSVGFMTMALDPLDEMQLVIHTTVATPVMPSVLAEWPFVVYKIVDGNRVFTGPYVIEEYLEDVLNLVPNVYYPGAENRNPITIKRFSSGEAVSAALMAGELDIAFNLPAASVSSLSWKSDLSLKSFQVGYQYMMFFNTNRSNLADIKVRKAISLAINRLDLAQAVAPPGLEAALVTKSVATGAFPAISPWASDHSPLVTDTSEAARLLDEAGWLLGTDGMRTNGAVQLSLELVYYTFRSDLVVFAPIIQSQLNALGVEVTLRINDDGDFTAGPGFDLLLWAQHTLPAGDPNWFLETFFRSGRVLPGAWIAQNFARVSSDELDSALDELATAEGTARTAAASEAHRIILDLVPATFLTTPTWHIGLKSSRMSTYEPWGSDYHVVRAGMPASDWPPAFTSARVYTLDGTMDGNGPPYGGIDWYESRVAEPDSMLADLIAVLHPTNTATAPNGLHYLRHARDGEVEVVMASDCIDPSAPHDVRAPTCASLIGSSASPEAVAELQHIIDSIAPSSSPPTSALPTAQGSPPPSPQATTTPVGAEDKADLRSVTYVLASCVGVLILAVVVGGYLYKKKAAEKREDVAFPNKEGSVAFPNKEGSMKA